MRVEIYSLLNDYRQILWVKAEIKKLPTYSLHEGMINPGLLAEVFNSLFDIFFYIFRLRNGSYISYLRGGS